MGRMFLVRLLQWDLDFILGSATDACLIHGKSLNLPVFQFFIPKMKMILLHLVCFDCKGLKQGTFCTPFSVVYSKFNL